MADPTELLERRIQRVLSGDESTRGLHLFCQVGGSYDDRGMITLQVSGSGWTLLSWSFGDDEEDTLYNLQLPQPTLERLFGMLLEHPYWTANPTRRSRPDGETNFHLRFSDQAAGTWNGLQFWTSDMKEFPVLSDLMYRVERLIQLLSDGEIQSLDLESLDD